MTVEKRIAVVVDGYSSGNYFPAAFAELTTQVIHVQSTQGLMKTMAAPDLSKYVANIVLDDGKYDERTLAQIRSHAPLCVVAGQESAVPLADQLGEILGVPSNGTAQSTARRNKYDMIEALRSAGLPCADQRKGSDVLGLADWADAHIGYPAVVKPLSSAATDGVYICRDRKELIEAARTVLASQDIFGGKNEEVLIQEYLEGPEYIVDTVSSAGKPYSCGTWRYQKTLLPSGQNIYDKDILLAEDDPATKVLAEYVFDVLTALGIKWGPAHAEVILTASGPKLVEVGARLNGNMHPGFHNQCIGHNQASLSALAYLDTEAFSRYAQHRVFTRRQPATVYNAPTDLNGVVSAIDQEVVSSIEKLPSVYLAAVKLGPGLPIKKTVDLMTTPLRVFLTATDQAALDRDYEHVKQLKDSVYELV